MEGWHWAGLGLILFLTTFGLLGATYIILLLAGACTIAYHYGKQKSLEMLSAPPGRMDFPSPGVEKITAKMENTTKTRNFDRRMTGAAAMDAILQEVLKYTVRDYIKTWYRQLSDHDGFLVEIHQCVQQIVIMFANRLLSSHCYDPMQFTELNLKPFWAQINDSSLRSLALRCTLCYGLDLSWCGNHGLVTVSGLEALLTVCGSKLTCLRLGSCGFVNAAVTSRIAALCPGLQELDLQSCPDLGSNGFRVLAGLPELRRLNLYRTQVDLASIVQIVRGCQKLEHLNLGSCINMSLQDKVLSEIGRNCPNLISLDLWRWKAVTEIGISAIATNCPRLQEIDVGWISSLRSSSGCYRQLAHHCRQLRKLVFTANRSVCDEDLDAIARFCPDLEQLDILGTGEVSKAAAQRILDSCKKLKFFDVSFCRNISFPDVQAWSALYPHVNIKQSFQT